MAITYYARQPDKTYWDSVWNANALQHLLAVADRDPLSEHLLEHLPDNGLILEGGCGLGQYVRYFHQRGYPVVGGDFSLTALRAHRRAFADSPLLGLDLMHLPFSDGVLQGHISLGVVEHVEAGPQALLREFYRTLAPGGTLLLSVPWMNGARRVLASVIRRCQQQQRATGAIFYQYAFSRRELRRFLIDTGFIVQAFYPYSPGKGTREIRHLIKPTGRDHESHVTAPPLTPQPKPVRPFRRLLYLPPFLQTFAHMILVIARKPAAGSHTC